MEDSKNNMEVHNGPADSSSLDEKSGKQDGESNGDNGQNGQNGQNGLTEAAIKAFTDKIDELTKKLDEQQKAHEKEMADIIKSIGVKKDEKTDFDKQVDYVIEKVNKWRQ